jgi:hypothetical protein
VNPDGRPWTEEELAGFERRTERAKVYQGGERVNVGKKAIKKEQLRNKMGRLEERIADAAEVSIVPFLET